MADTQKLSYLPSITNLTTWNSVFVWEQKTKRSHESVTAFQQALVLIVSLKQLFSSHSVPTSHSQLLAACTHMYIHPHSHFICGGNRHSFRLARSLSFVLNVSLFFLSDRYSPHLKCLELMNVVLNRLSIMLYEVLDGFGFIHSCTVSRHSDQVHNNALFLIIFLPAMILMHLWWNLEPGLSYIQSFLSM